MWVLLEAGGGDGKWDKVGRHLLHYWALNSRTLVLQTGRNIGFELLLLLLLLFLFFLFLLFLHCLLRELLLLNLFHHWFFWFVSLYLLFYVSFSLQKIKLALSLLLFGEVYIIIHFGIFDWLRGHFFFQISYILGKLELLRLLFLLWFLLSFLWQLLSFVLLEIRMVKNLTNFQSIFRVDSQYLLDEVYLHRIYVNCMYTEAVGEDEGFLHFSDDFLSGFSSKGGISLDELE